MNDVNINYINMLLQAQTISSLALDVLTKQIKEIEDLPGAEPLRIILEMSRSTIEVQAEMIRNMGESNLRIGDQIADLVAKVNSVKEAP